MHGVVQSGLHRWRDAQRLVDAAEIVVQGKQRDHRGVFLGPLAEGIGQAGESSHSMWRLPSIPRTAHVKHFIQFNFSELLG